MNKMQKSQKDAGNVQSASLIDLKAELFRKQEEFKVQKLQNQSSGFIKGKTSTVTKKPSLFSKKNAGVSSRAEKDYEEKVEEENVFDRSRKALEDKAKLYEKISSGTAIPEEDGSGLFLVDFQKKVLDDVAEKHERERKDQEDEERREIEEEQRQLLEPVPPPENEEEEWVDYVDAFGRSRRCLRKDLPDIQKQDASLQQRKRKMDEKTQKGLKEFAALRDKMTADTPSLLSNDMKRELDRQKWEKEEIGIMEEEKKGPIHYTDVQHNEIRTHGVGYYKFDQEENIRQEQMEQLNQLRQQTKDERSKVEKIKEKRKAALAARLAKVKARKRARLGFPEPEGDENVSSDEEIGPKVSEQSKIDPEPLTRDDSWRSQTLSTRDWDKGKQYSMEKTEEAWLEKQRAEREDEFAPPSFYYDNIPDKKSNGKTKKAKSSHDISGNVQSIIGEQLSNIRHRKDAANEINKNDAYQDAKNNSNTRATDTSSKAAYLIGDTTTTHSSASNTLAVNLNILPRSSLNQSYDIFDTSRTDLSSSVTNFQQTSYFPPHSSVVPPPPNSYTCPSNSCSIYTDTSVPPPNNPSNLNIPLPNASVTPFNCNVPPPNYNVPPPGYNIPPPNVNVLPPNFNIPTPTSDTHTSVASNFEQTKTVAEVDAHPIENVKKIFIAKEDIIDTRLMENCD